MQTSSCQQPNIGGGGGLDRHLIIVHHNSVDFWTLSILYRMFAICAILFFLAINKVLMDKYIYICIDDDHEYHLF